MQNITGTHIFIDMQYLYKSYTLAWCIHSAMICVMLDEWYFCEICERSCIIHYWEFRPGNGGWITSKFSYSFLFSFSLSFILSFSLLIRIYRLFRPCFIMQVQISWWPTALQPVKCAGICFANFVMQAYPDDEYERLVIILDLRFLFI